MQRFFFLANIDDAFLVCACFYETRLDGIVETVLCRLIDHRYGCNGIHVRQRRSGGAGGGKAEREEVVLPSPGSPCMIVSLPKGIYGYHSQSTSRTWMSDILSSFSSSFFIIFFLSVLCWSVSFGTIIAIPPFIKIHFRFADHGSVLREKVHSPSSVFVPCSPCPLLRAHRLRLSPTARSFGSLSSQSPPPHILSAGYSVVFEKTSSHSSKGNDYPCDIKLS